MREVGTLYKATGKVVEVHPHDQKKFTLEELQFFVGGYIEKVPGTLQRRGNPIAYCNEDGLRLNLPPNQFASEKFGIVLVGDVVEVRRKREVRS